MRTITTNLYTFAALSDQAKENARAWWRDLEQADPAWREEHFESCRVIIHALERLHHDDALEDWKELRLRSYRTELTGYCADCILYEKSTPDRVPSIHAVKSWYELEWRKELASRMENEHVDEAIRMNEYEFTAEGNRPCLSHPHHQ